MRLRDVIRAPKTEIKVGSWHNGKVPKAEFPLARGALRLGSSFEWCVVSFQALGAEARVLVLFNPLKMRYDASLGVLGANGIVRLLCTYQYHAAEPGWHVHAACDRVSLIPAGIFRGPWVRRIPKAGRYHGQLEFGIDTKKAALRFAFMRYRIEEKGPLV